MSHTPFAGKAERKHRKSFEFMSSLFMVAYTLCNVTNSFCKKICQKLGHRGLCCELRFLITFSYCYQHIFVALDVFKRTDRILRKIII